MRTSPKNLPCPLFAKEGIFGTIKLSFIPRPDWGIHCVKRLLDCLVKPDADKIRAYAQTLFKRIYNLCLCLCFFIVVCAQLDDPF